MALSVVLFLCILVGALASSPEENLNLGRSGESFFEGDIILTPEQQQIINGMARGSIIKNLWPNGVVPYVIQSSISQESKAMAAVEAAFAAWQSTTCIQFKKRTTESAYISIFKGSGCWSYVGKTGGMQQLSLASGCWYKGTVVHELGHALGFYHEQSRPDRDDYVTIMWDNIREANKHNFKKHPESVVNSLGTTYDYGSIMHYGERYFSKNGRPTIVTKNGASIGNRKDLSATDIKQMNLLYKCGGGGGGGGGAVNPPPPSNCKDVNVDCAKWASKGYCQTWKDYMKKYCQKTCNHCA